MIRKWLTMCTVILAALSTLGTGHGCFADESSDHLALRDVPKAVRRAILREAHGADVESIEQETKDGQVTYEAAWTIDSTKYEAVVDANGALLETERSVSTDALPKSVRRVLSLLFRKGTPMGFEEKHVVLYEAEATVNGGVVEVVLTASGQVVSVTTEEEEAEEAVDDDGDVEDDDDGDVEDDDDGDVEDDDDGDVEDDDDGDVEDDDDGDVEDDDDGDVEDDDDGDVEDHEENDSEDEDEEDAAAAKISLSDCPKAVIKTIRRESRGGEIEDIEFENGIYEVDVDIDGMDYELKIREDGTLMVKKLEEDD